MSEPESFVRVKNVWKVFGKDPKRVLSKRYRAASKEYILKNTGAVLALRKNSFSVERGELFVLMGLSGSGKSTLIRTLLRLVEPSEGTIHVGDQEVTALDREQLRRYRSEKVSMVFQHYGLFPHYTVLQNAAYGLKARGESVAEREEKARAALQTVGVGRMGRLLPARPQRRHAATRRSGARAGYRSGAALDGRTV